MLNSSCIPFSPYIYNYLLEAGYTHLFALSKKPATTEAEREMLRISYLLPLKRHSEPLAVQSDGTLVELATMDITEMLLCKNVFFRILLFPDGVINTGNIISL